MTAARRQKKRPRKPRKWRVLVLVHEELVPPDTLEGVDKDALAEWRTEYDVVSTLKKLGHDVRVLGVGDEIDAIRRAAEEFQPRVVFNLLVEFHGAATYDQHVASYLELLKLNYTGCNPLGMTLARDKALSKKILVHHRVRVPRYRVFPLSHKMQRPKQLRFPLFVKSVNEEASLGIAKASIVRSDEELAARVTLVHESVGSDAIAEQFIEGREFYVGVLGNARPKIFPIWELCIDKLPEGAPNVATRKLKWNLAYQRRLGVENRRAEGLTALQEKEIARIARTVYRQLGLSGYARIDLRMREDGRCFVLEANPNPELAKDEDFAEAAEAAGIAYEELIQRILALGAAYPSAWKESGG